MRTALNSLYRLSGILAATCLVVIALMVIVQVLGRIIDSILTTVGFQPVGLLVPSLAEFAGFFLVGASFLALAATLRMGDHIRVSILLHMLPKNVAKVFEVWCVGVALALGCFFTWHAGLLAQDSFIYNESSYGIIPVPLWVPQSVMTLGLFCFTVSLLDDFARALVGKATSYAEAKSADVIEGVE